MGETALEQLFVLFLITRESYSNVSLRQELNTLPGRRIQWSVVLAEPQDPPRIPSKNLARDPPKINLTCQLEFGNVLVMKWCGFLLRQRVCRFFFLGAPLQKRVLLLQICPFRINQLQVAPPATLLFSYFCIVAGGCRDAPSVQAPK